MSTLNIPRDSWMYFLIPWILRSPTMYAYFECPCATECLPKSLNASWLCECPTASACPRTLWMPSRNSECPTGSTEAWTCWMSPPTQNCLPDYRPSPAPKRNPLWWFLEQSMGARNRVRIGLSYRPARARIIKLVRSPGIDSKESFPPAYVAWRAGTIILFLLGS